jgi:hypothetical protein
LTPTIELANAEAAANGMDFDWIDVTASARAA